jgi:hypothetical protein
MIQKIPPARRMSEKKLRARIDRVIAEEERIYGRRLELRDVFHAFTGELDSPTASLPSSRRLLPCPRGFPGASRDHTVPRGGEALHPPTRPAHRPNQLAEPAAALTELRATVCDAGLRYAVL